MRTLYRPGALRILTDELIFYYFVFFFAATNLEPIGSNQEINKLIMVKDAATETETQKLTSLYWISCKTLHSHLILFEKPSPKPKIVSKL